MNFFGKILLIIVAVCAFAVPAHAQPERYPARQGYVNDFAGVLSESQRSALAEELGIFESQTANDFAVVTVTSLQGYPIETFASGLAYAWGIGRGGNRNSIVFLVASNEHEFYIDAGGSPEALLSDGMIRRRVEAEVASRVRENRMDQAVTEGARAILRHYASAGRGNPSDRLFWLIVVAVGAMVGAVPLVAAIFRRSESRQRVLRGFELMTEDVEAFKKRYRAMEVMLIALEGARSDSVASLRGACGAIQAAAIERAYGELKKVFERKVPPLSEAKDRLDSLGRILRDASAPLDDLECAYLLLMFGPRFDEASDASPDRDISDETKRAISELRARFRRVRGGSPRSASNAERVIELRKLSSELPSLLERIQADRKLAEEARAKVPELIKSLARRLGNLTGDPDASRIRSKYDQALALSGEPDPESLRIYLMLMETQRLLDRREGEASAYASISGASASGTP